MLSFSNSWFLNVPLSARLYLSHFPFWVRFNRRLYSHMFYVLAEGEVQHSWYEARDPYVSGVKHSWAERTSAVQTCSWQTRGRPW